MSQPSPDRTSLIRIRLRSTVAPGRVALRIDRSTATSTLALSPAYDSSPAPTTVPSERDWALMIAGSEAAIVAAYDARNAVVPCRANRCRSASTVAKSYVVRSTAYWRPAARAALRPSSACRRSRSR
jgi:hypothetical protein